MRVKIIFFVLLGFLMACSSEIDRNTYELFQQKGNNITMKTQATLLKNVGKAIQKGGPEYAVEFCNIEANTIVDSLNHIHNCSISRISIKNRNPKAKLSNSKEQELWNAFEQGTVEDTLIRTKHNYVFYKPIKIAMPACLKCHGNSDSDINAATMQKLQELYPEDLATGYSLNDFRGLWKVEFERE